MNIFYLFLFKLIISLFCQQMKRKLFADLQRYLKSSQLIQPNLQSLNRFAKHDIIPLATLQCRDISDISHSIKFCNQNNIDYVVKSSGTNQAVTSIKSNSLILDISPLTNIQVAFRIEGVRVKFECGVNFEEIQHYLGKVNFMSNVGYAMPYAQYRGISGIGAHTIMGNGLFHRRCGVGVDLIESAKVILSNGDIVTANSQQNSDLLWGVKGCGPNMGVIVELTEFLPQSRCNFLDPKFREQIRMNSYNYPINQKTINMGQYISLAFKNLQVKQFPFLIFSKNKQTSFLNFLNFQTLYNKKEKKINYERNVEMDKIMKEMVCKFNGKNNTEKELIFKAKGKSATKEGKQKFYYQLGGGSTIFELLQPMLKEILIFYNQNPLDKFEGTVFLNTYLTSLDCQTYQSRDPSLTSWPNSKEQTIFIYFQLVYSDNTIKTEIQEYARKYQSVLRRYLKVGSACDINAQDIFDDTRARWIYRQNYQKLKIVRQKYDPMNKFGKGLF